MKGKGKAYEPVYQEASVRLVSPAGSGPVANVFIAGTILCRRWLRKQFALLLDERRRARRFDLDLGDGPGSYSGAVVENHQGSNQRSRGLGIGKHGGLLVAAASRQCGHQDWRLGENAEREYES